MYTCRSLQSLLNVFLQKGLISANRRADRKPTDTSRVCTCHFPRGLGQAPVLLSAAQRIPQPEVVIQSVFERVATRRGVVQAAAESTALEEDEQSAAVHHQPASDHNYGHAGVVGVEDAGAAVAVLHVRISLSHIYPHTLAFPYRNGCSFLCLDR